MAPARPGHAACLRGAAVSESGCSKKPAVAVALFAESVAAALRRHRWSARREAIKVVLESTVEANAEDCEMLFMMCLRWVGKWS